ncbi:MAG: hypothetical protein AB7O49_10155 [Sphingomonadales bacterium]
MLFNTPASNILAQLAQRQDYSTPPFNPDMLGDGSPLPNFMQTFRVQPGSDVPQPTADDAVRDIERQVFAREGVPYGRRTSALNILGGIADTFAEIGGATPMYQRTLDARADRQRQAEQDAINNQYKQSLINQAQFNQRQQRLERLPGLAARLQQIYKAQGPQGLAAAWNYAGTKLLGFSPEETQAYGAHLMADPEGVLSLFGALNGQPETKYQEVGDALVALGPDGVKEVYRAPARPGVVKQITMDGPEGPGIYNIDASGQPVGKVGGVVRTPSTRQPSVAEQRYAYLLGQGVPPAEARAIALGLVTNKTDANGVTTRTNLATGQTQTIGGNATGGITPPKLAQDRAAQNDRIDTTLKQIDQTLAGPDWQSGSGAGNAIDDAINVVTGFFGGEGVPERARQKRDIKQLKQLVATAMKTDNRVFVSDFQRAEELLPSGGWFESDEQARQAMAGIRALLEEIRSRPIAVDPRTGDNREAAPAFEGDSDPLGILK